MSITQTQVIDALIVFKNETKQKPTVTVVYSASKFQVNFDGNQHEVCFMPCPLLPTLSCPTPSDGYILPYGTLRRTIPTPVGWLKRGKYSL